ncbi:sugar transferase [Haloarcula salinisoli]|uniref:Exopolysaccharide biosynthesis polyprenyl glycosylphosphotransferase n=1 Tax=Haloarcula salinisoli TaxID=2487746 RepID=A0A8J7YFY2_9EURY|nr:exopolysaccharide biosynthesis polyprenyl glycosylphosphotransferase [Halomicroarcula salinisoli]MBX0287829.1 exopolysaccharide biosynthesis polyprenyl glycosylphosphotransferase [Halomicroarcula salinisoli]MBX0304772.1 exopolysaccharide biosynthesis polyprenyl glycosylphosphotransferase [Halomicroarcula salinisoli]
MQSGLRYRLTAVCGATLWVASAVVIANSPPVQMAVTAVPPLNNLQPTTFSNGQLLDQVIATVVVTLAVLWPLFKPRPRRILDTIALTHERVFVTAAVLATIGYFDWSSRLPRTTLVATILCLGIVLPVWFVVIRRRPSVSKRAIIVGDDTAVIEQLFESATVPILGVVAPSDIRSTDRPQQLADGGVTIQRPEELPRLGGLSRLDDVLVDHDIDTVLLAFAEPDREEFFGTLATCFEHGVQAKVHRDHATSVLVDDATGGEIVDTNLEPWDWQDYVLKRVFDVAFAGLALLCLAPVLTVIAAAIKLDSRGPVLYSQTRTAAFGETFKIYKFRSMVVNAEAKTGAKLSEEDAGDRDPRVTRVGRVLRRTHLDEIPQLWSILVGDMSVVGPRPERPELDADIETNVEEWRSRWFVKPGLTGMAQINDVTGHQPAEKIRYDIQYIRNQSFSFDLKIVVRQLYGVVVDVGALIKEKFRRQ